MKGVVLMFNTAGWAISTGAKREGINGVEDLKTHNKVGVSRIGSGSYVMSFVLADQQGWLSSTAPFEFFPLQTFAALRNGVNDGTADFFMWEHFTSKRYYDSGEIRRIGEIYTPWPSWQIVASTSLPTGDSCVEELFQKLDQGIRYFEGNKEESVKYISTNLDYSVEDAREWLKTVKFAKGTRGVDTQVVEKTVGVLRKAGVLKEGGGLGVEGMIGIKRTS